MSVRGECVFCVCMVRVCGACIWRASVLCVCVCAHVYI